MSSKKLLLNIIALIGFICLFIVPFVSIFEYVAGTDAGSHVVGVYGIFADFSNFETAQTLLNGGFSSTWPLLNSIFIVATIVFALAYIVIVLIGIVKGKLSKTLIKTQKLLAVLILISAILMVVFGTMVTILSHVEIASAPWIELAGTTGLFLQFGAVIGAIFAMLASCTKK